MPRSSRRKKVIFGSTLLRTGAFPLLITLLIFSLPVRGYCGWEEVETILSKAYGPEVAKECSDYYSGLDIPDERVPAIREAVERLVKAGYPAGCPVEYLKAASELSRAGIDLGDLTNKIREGLAKKVSPERLLRVIVQRAEALLEARVTVLELENKGVDFLDKQMAYSVMADYLLRGVQRETISAQVLEGDLARLPALDNLIR